MKRTYVIAGILICIALSFNAAAQNDMQLTGTWKITDIGVDANDDGVAENSTWRTCNEGSTISFNADGTGSYYKGTHPCSSTANPQNFTWQKDAQDNVIMKLNGKQDKLSIKKKSATQATVAFTSAKIMYTLVK